MNKPYFFNRLKVATWNANSLMYKLNEFKHFVYSRNYDIVGICETKLDKNAKFNIPGFKCYTCHRNKRGGGVAILIRDCIEHAFVNMSNINNIELITIKLPYKQSFLHIVQVYIPPNVSIKYADLDKLFSFDNMIVMGDMNGKRKEWNCNSDNPRGKILIDFCLDKNIVISSPKDHTNFPPVGAPSILDIFLLKCKLQHSLPISLPLLNSNHNPVEIFFDFKYRETQLIKSYDYNNANWVNFKEQINNKFKLHFHIENTAQLEQKCSQFLNVVQCAIRDNIPSKTIDSNASKLPNYIKKLIKVKNKIRKKCQKRPTAFCKGMLKTAERLVYKLIRNYNSKKLENIIKKLDPNDGSFWKFCKKYSKKSEFLPSVMFDKNNEELLNDNDKANAFAEHFANISNVERNLGIKSFSLKVSREVRKFMKSSVDADEIKFVSYLELSKIVKDLKNNKSPGDDNITAVIMKHLPRKALVFFLKIINGILLTGTFPSVWKTAKVIPVPKKGKDLSRLTGSRPISLLPLLGKITEKCVKKRIVMFLEEKKILVNEQFGFRTGHGTVDQLVRLINEITKNFNYKKHTGALLLDIADAFSTVWLDGLIFKMIKLGFPAYLIRVICSYIKDRKLFVKFNRAISKLYDLFSGVPQGSVLGPILFIIFINDAPMLKNVDVSLFADDKLIFTASHLIRTIMGRLQKALDKNRKYFHKWKIKLNDGKTEAIIFTKRRPEFGSNVKIGNFSIPWSDSVIYLGVTLDNRLNFLDHIRNIISKSIAKLISLYPIFNRNSNFSVASKLLLYKTVVRPTITYACSAWSYISNSSFGKLQILQNKFLRLIGNYRSYTPIDQMHKELNIEFIHQHIKNLAEKYFIKIDNHENSFMRNIKYENTKLRHKRILNILYN